MYFELHIFLEWRSYILFLQTGLGWKGMKLCLEDFSSSGPFKLLAAACWKIHFLIAWWTCFRVVFYCNFFKIFTHSYVYVDIFNCLYESTQSQASWLGHLWGGEGGGQDSDEAKTCSKRKKEQAQAKNRNRNNAFQSDMPAGRRILWSRLGESCFWAVFFLANAWSSRVCLKMGYRGILVGKTMIDQWLDCHLHLWCF